MRAIRTLAGATALSAVLALAPPLHAGVVHPDVSLIGQPIVRWTDAPGDPASKHMLMNGIPNAAGSLRPQDYQEAQCA